MSFPAELMPQNRRLLIVVGAAAALCEWAAAAGAWYAHGAAKPLLGALTLLFALFLFMLSLLRPGGLGGRAFAANFAAGTILYGAVFLGFFIFMVGPLEGGALGFVLAPVIGLAAAVRSTWPLGFWR